MHICGFIVEHCGHLCLSTKEIAAQMKLPVEPLPPPPVIPLVTPTTSPPQPANLSGKPPHKKKAPAKPLEPPVATW